MLVRQMLDGNPSVFDSHGYHRQQAERAPVRLAL